MFEGVRWAVARLGDVKTAIMVRGEEWRPPSVAARNATPDPTASAAIRNVDEVDPRLRALQEEESELEDFIGEALVIIQAVRDGLGDKYADVLDWRYIDCATWEFISKEYGVEKRTGYRRRDVACDWVDSIGITRILAGDYEI